MHIPFHLRFQVLFLRYLAKRILTKTCLTTKSSIIFSTSLHTEQAVGIIPGLGIIAS